MKKLNILKNIYITFISLMLTTNVWSIQTSEPNGINKKDVVDEIDRSEIEENEKTETLKIDNIIPAFEMPDLKESRKKSKTKSSKNTDKKNKDRTLKTVKNQNSDFEEIQKPNSDTKVIKKVRKKKSIISKKYLKASQIQLKDIIVYKNNTQKIHREVGKYIYKYRSKEVIPKDSEGLMLISENKYMVVDNVKLISDVNLGKEALLVNELQDKKILTEVDLSDEIIQKRRSLEKKYNRGKLIRFSVSRARLKESDVIYVFGEVQMVSRKQTGPSSSVKKYWLYPLIDVNNPSLLKMSNNKYKVLRKL